MRLNDINISKIAEKIPCPSYDRKQLKTGIVHIGVGGFHRAHQAYYIHRLIEMHNTKDWAICGVGLQATDKNIADVLKKQDCLYTLATQHPNGKVESEVIGSIAEYLLADDYEAQSIIDKLAHPNTKIVSLTITEGGYNFNAVTGDFNFENTDIQHDLKYPKTPKTVYGYLTAALRKRLDNSLPPFTVLSCDNIQHNGDMARKMVLAYAEKQDGHLADWIENEVSFPNTMVDRITPVTPPKIIDYLKREYDLEDDWPVVCEPFIQWVIEDNFSNGRPPLEELGVQFVSDVAPYEKMKIRLLNAGHSVLGIPGAVYGHPTIDACMRDGVFARFMRKFMDLEVTPILDMVEGIDIEKYKDNLEERFANPNLKDSVSRICSESSSKLPKFLIPTIKENLANGGSIKYAIFILAAWCYYSDKGVKENGEILEIIDAQKDGLHRAAKNTENAWSAFLKFTEIFSDLKENERFVKEYTTMVQAIYKEKNIRKLMQGLM